MSATSDMTEPQPVYSSGLEHITDELARLDLLIRSRLSRRGKNRPRSPLDSFAGLVVSEEEVIALLDGNPDGNEMLDQALSRKLDECCDRIESRLRASSDDNVYLPLPHISRLFGLNTFEQLALILCLAPEIEVKYEKLYEYLQDDVTRKKPTVELLSQLFSDHPIERINARLSFRPEAPLIKHRLLSFSDANDPMPSRSLKLDNRIVDYLLGLGVIDERLAGSAKLILPDSTTDSISVDETILTRVSSYAQSHLLTTLSSDQLALIFYFRGTAGTGKRAMAEAVCRELDLPLVIADLDKILDSGNSFLESVDVLCREAILQPAALCIDKVDCVLSDEGRRAQVKPLLDAIEVYSRLTFLLAEKPWRPRGELTQSLFIDQEFTVPSANSRRTLWKRALEEASVASDVEISTLASTFQFTADQIRTAVAGALTLASWRAGRPNEIDVSDLQKACRNQSTTKLSSLAQKIEPRYTWDDIVLPDDQLAQLREICIHARHRDVVYGDWGFDRKLSLGRGLNVLFSGPAGTGKTMAAEIIASDLGLDLYKIDLSQVVSKYIGETEKNLNHVFLEAKTSYAILFFDEADSLFGKRSEVKDAHDRYANIEIGFLLQKMEEYDGIAILATNLRQNLDEAFVRRLQVIVDFPFPTETYRKLIWDVIFPCESPIASDVDFALLAREITLAGGSIKNIALAAASLAAEDGESIRMPHLVRASRREYQKLGRLWSESNWREHSTQ